MLAWLLVSAIMFRLCDRFWRLASYSIEAIPYRFQLDYGEGVVWQQALLILSPSAYGPIDRFPATPFEYAPLFHLVTRAAVALTGGDGLALGRSVSLCAAVLLAMLIFIITERVSRQDAEPMRTKATALAGLISALLFLTSGAAAHFAVLMRVDALAILLAVSGFATAALSVQRRALIVPAAFLFVGAVYTKQNTIAAPLAVFATLLWLTPRTALIGIATCLLVGGPILALLIQRSDGRVLLHLFRYNINVVTGGQIRLLAVFITSHAALIAIAAMTIRSWMQHAAFVANRESIARLRQRVLTSSCARWRLFLVAYTATTTMMLSGMAKTGASSNYAMEWSAVVSIVTGVGLREFLRWLTSTNRVPMTGHAPFLPLLLLTLHTWSKPARLRANTVPDGEVVALDSLTRIVREDHRPIISDEMVLVIRAGKAIELETALFTDLAKQGLVDEAEYIARIRRRDFAMFVVQYEQGSEDFNARYSPAVADAIAESYHFNGRIGSYNVFLPAPP